MWPFSRPKPTPAAEPRQTVFSTDAQAPDGKDRRIAMRDALARSIQKTPDDFKFVTPEGVAMDASNIQNSAKAIFAAGGQNMPDAQLYWYASQGFIGYQLCAILAQNWLIEKCCVQPGRDAVRTGYEITTGDGVEVGTKVINAIKRADKKYRINRHMVEFVKFGRTFGIRIAMFMVESSDPEYYQKPFNPDGVTANSYKGINQIDPYWCAPELTEAAACDPLSGSFYEPTYWLVNNKRIHRSHLVIMRGAEVPDMLKPSYLYGGVSIPQRIYERVYAAERTANESPLLALSKRSRVLSTDLAKVAANPAKMLATLTARADRLNNFGTDVIDKESDKVEHHDTTLTDMDSVIMTQYQLVAAAANYPATKLLGTQPKGFNSSGDYEETVYHEELESIQTHDLTPLLDGHHLRVWRSDIVPNFPGLDVNTLVEHAWNPTDSPTATEQATINKTKAETGKILSESGAIDGQDERQRITLDKDSGYAGLKAVQPEPDQDGDPNTRNPLAVPAPVQAPGLPVQDAHAMDMDLDPWDSAAGTLGGAALVTNQTHIDPIKVAEKQAAKDYGVQVTPEFVDLRGNAYRVVIDGHHSLAAALVDGVTPAFQECDYTGTDYRNAVTAMKV